MRAIIRHLLPGIGLIALLSGLLLMSDWGSRNREDKHASKFTSANPAKIGILQPTSNKVMDDMCQGMLAGLASRGYREGDNLQKTVLIAQGDQPTMAVMAQKIVSGNFDVAASISTLCLQSLAAADQKGRMPMVFCGVTSPVAAAVGIKSMDSLDKPAHMTGYGTAQPVEAIFREAVAANPKLKVVGVVWNPAEANSLVCTTRARAICKELGLTLLEAPIEGAKDVREAADSLVARGAEAFWTGGDATVIAAYDLLQQSATKAHIPIFSNISGQAKAGALFDYGANYYEVGFAAGQLAADVLDGHSPGDIPVHDLMPGRMGLNEKARESLRDTWTFTPSQYDNAGYIVERTGDVREIKPAAGAATTAGVNTPDTRPAATPANGKLPWRIEIILYLESAPAEEVLGGLTEGFKQSGLVEGRDYVIHTRNAQGDMAVLNTLFDAAASDGTDMYLTLSTPTLQAAVRKVQNRPLIFSMVS
ncbi:MAG TPA: ABC transporter substrate binding protein, partial [Opitutales bacterium]|nr:ABC transporter substrate binding protein [Opitutales bacterium]